MAEYADTTNVTIPLLTCTICRRLTTTMVRVTEWSDEDAKVKASLRTGCCDVKVRVTFDGTGTRVISVHRVEE